MKRNALVLLILLVFLLLCVTVAVMEKAAFLKTSPVSGSGSIHERAAVISDVTTDERESNVPTKFSLPKGRAVSLRVLQTRLRSLSTETTPSDEMIHLGGIARLCGYVIDENTHDLILFGDSVSSRPALHLEDFIVALRNAWSLYDEIHENVRYYSDPGCSIDPDGKMCQELQALARHITSANSPDEAESFLPEWHKICMKPQRVRVMGVPFDCRFAQVMVKADYDMKTLVDGSDDSLNISEFASLVDMTLDRIRPAVIQGNDVTMPAYSMHRFWFCPAENHYAEIDKIGAVIIQCPVKLLTEEEYLSTNGTAQGVGHADALAQEFCNGFTEHYSRIAERRPIYAELENLYRFVATAKLMEHFDCAGVAGLELDYLITKCPIGIYEARQTLPGRSNIKRFQHRKEFDGGYSDLYLWLPSCGGVSIEISPNKARYKATTEAERELQLLKAQVLMERPNENSLSWNFHFIQKSELDEWSRPGRTFVASQLVWLLSD